MILAHFCIVKYMKKIFAVSAVSVMLIALFECFYPLSGWILSNKQKRMFQIVSSVITENGDRKPLRDLREASDWDRICVIPPYAFSPLFSDQDNIA
jgi:hypothetical protein